MTYERPTVETPPPSGYTRPTGPPAGSMQLVPQGMPQNYQEPPGSWLSENVMSPLMWVFGSINAGSVYSTQLAAQNERNRRAIDAWWQMDVLGQHPDDIDPEIARYHGEFGLPEFSTWDQAVHGEYTQEDTAGLAMSDQARRGPFGIQNPLYQIEEMIRGPESETNQFITSGRWAVMDNDMPAVIARTIEAIQEAAPADHFIHSAMGQTGTTLINTLSPLMTEQMVAETTHDPLFVLEAMQLPIKAVNALGRFTNAAIDANRIMGAATDLSKVDRAMMNVNRGIVGINDFGVQLGNVVDHVSDAGWRRVYRAARPYISDEQFQRGMFDFDMKARESDLQSSLGRDFMRTEGRYPQLMGEVSEAIERIPPETSAMVAGVDDAFEYTLDYSRRTFPDIPAPAQRQIAEIIDTAWTKGIELPEIERLLGLPVDNLAGDISYMRHASSIEARDALNRSIPDWRLRNEARMINNLGEIMTAVGRKRSYRDTINVLNQMAETGLVGAVNGKIMFLTPQAADLQRVFNRVMKRATSLADQTSRTWQRGVDNGTYLQTSMTPTTALDDIGVRMPDPTSATSTFDPNFFATGRTAAELKTIAEGLQNKNITQGLEQLRQARDIGLADGSLGTGTLRELDNIIRQFETVVEATAGRTEDMLKKVREGKWNPESMMKRLREAGLDASIVPETPRGWEPITKLLEDNPYRLISARFGMNTRALAGRQFLKEMSTNPAFIINPEDAILKKNPTLKGLLERTGEYDRTWALLGDDFTDIAENIYWKDGQTAEGVLKQLRVMRDMKIHPAPWLHAMDTAISTWRASVLTPFLSFHNRNIIGGLLNGFMSGNMDILDVLDATFPTYSVRTKLGGSTRNLFEEFRRAGGADTSQMGDELAHASEMGRMSRNNMTPFQSVWEHPMNPIGPRFYGRTAGQAIEMHQRFALYLGARRRGKTAAQAAELMFKYMFDYADVPSWFQHGTWARRVAAFPTWTMKNIPLQFEHLIKNPTQYSIRGRAINQYNQLAEDQGGIVLPEWVTEMGGFGLGGQDGYFRPENFDPAAGIGEVANMVKPLTEGEPLQAGRNAVQFLFQMMNPFFTEPLQQALPTPEIQRGYDRDRIGWETTGYDVRMGKTIYQDWRPESELMQRGEHILKSFFRGYNEISNFVRKVSGSAEEGDAPFTAIAQVAGIPYGEADQQQAIYYALGNNDRDLGGILDDIEDTTATDEQLTDLKDLYLQRLGYLAHGSFLQSDPWTGEPRPWNDVAATMSERSIKGTREYFRDYLETTYLILYGRTGMGNQDRHQPIPLDSDEREMIYGLHQSALAAYQAMMFASVEEDMDINVGSEIGYLENREFYEVPE